MIGYFQLFAEPYVMTQGGPLRSTTSVVLLMYEEGFRWWRMGSAAAVAFVLFVIIAGATLAQRKISAGRQAPKERAPSAEPRAPAVASAEPPAAGVTTPGV